MTYDELLTLQSDVSRALRSKEPVNGNLVFEKGKLKIYYLGIVEKYSKAAQFQIENATDRDLSVTVENVSVNDFMINTLFVQEVKPGKKAIANMDLLYLDDYNITDITDIGLSFRVYDSVTYQDIYDVVDVSITPDAQ